LSGSSLMANTPAPEWWVRSHRGTVTTGFTMSSTEVTMLSPPSLSAYICGSRVGLLDRNTVRAPRSRIAAIPSAAPGSRALPR
jgi:hypothetical protein